MIKTMNSEPERKHARSLAKAYIESGDPLGWFEVLYRQAGGESQRVPWADLKPNVHLVEWMEKQQALPDRAAGRRMRLGR